MPAYGWPAAAPADRHASVLGEVAPIADEGGVDGIATAERLARHVVPQVAALDART